MIYGFRQKQINYDTPKKKNGASQITQDAITKATRSNLVILTPFQLTSCTSQLNTVKSQAGALLG
jgi:hypothetical protein